MTRKKVKNNDVADYVLADQIGHILRKASQRHSTIFSTAIPSGLTPTRFAALVVLYQKETLSQNELGRATSMDVATIKGVVDRLNVRGLVTVKADPNDARRKLIRLTEQGKKTIAAAISVGIEISETTLAQLTPTEQSTLTELLNKII